MITIEPGKWLNFGTVESLRNSIPKTFLAISEVRKFFEILENSNVFIITKSSDCIYMKYELSSINEGISKMRLQQIAAQMDVDVWEETHNRGGDTIYKNVATGQELTEKQYKKKSKESRGILFGSSEWNTALITELKTKKEK